MEIIGFLLFCVVIKIGDSVGTSTKANSSQLQTKITNAMLSKDGEYKYMASLQIDGKHICSSAIFRWDLLLTTGVCASHIRSAMKNGSKECTAVFGDSNLKNGQSINILRVANHPRFMLDDYTNLNKHSDIGVVMLANELDHTLAEPLDLYDEKKCKFINMNDPIVCGWGATLRDNFETNNVLYAEYSDNLYCVPVNLYSRYICKDAIPPGDFKDCLLCGQPGYPKQEITLGDVGSPLIITIATNGEEKAYISGITLDPYESSHGLFLRFIRASRLREDMQKIMVQLQPEIAKKASWDRSDKQDIINIPSKRQKSIKSYS